MLEKMTDADVLQYRPLTEEEKSRGILGRLFGNVADTFRATRNGRKYSEELWEKVFNNNLVKEGFQSGGIPGELDHPTDRVETCSEKIAIMMPNPPKKGKDGKLVAYFDILDTPNGRIAYTLARYGYKFGISSRGDGEVEENYDGTSEVTPDSFDFKAFDLVLLPAVKEARMQLVAESFDTKRSMKSALVESLNNSTEDERKIMEDTLDKLNIDYKPEMADNTECETEEDKEAENSGSDLLEELQVALKEKKAREDTIAELHEKLSVCYAKEAKYEDTIAESQKVSAKLAEVTHANEVLTAQNSHLTEQLEQSKTKVGDLKRANARLLESKRRDAKEHGKTLNENLDKSNAIIAELKEKIKVLEENARNDDSTNKVQKLNESISELKKDATIKSNEYSRKLAKANSLTEQYKGVAEMAVNKYIDCQAVKLGIEPEEIKDRLSANYSLEDIDRLCESIQSQQARDNRLPFNTKSKKLSISVTSPTKENYYGEEDGTVDDTLLYLAGRYS